MISIRARKPSNSIVALFLLCSFLITGPAVVDASKLTLTTDSPRESIQLTIYQNADLTLVREERVVNLQEGSNKIRVDWTNARIDPSSLQIQFPDSENTVQVKELSYPDGAPRTAVWTVNSNANMQTTMVTSYFRLGIDSNVFYQGFYRGDRQTLQLHGYFDVSNRSNQVFPRSRVRIVIGEVKLLENLSQKLQSWYRRGKQNQPEEARAFRENMQDKTSRARALMQAEQPAVETSNKGPAHNWVMTLDGRISLGPNESSRVSFVSSQNVPVNHLHEFTVTDDSTEANTYLTFTNDTSAQLGDHPLPEGKLFIYQSNGTDRFTGFNTVDIPYSPGGQLVKLDMGKNPEVGITRDIMNIRYEDHDYNPEGILQSWNTIIDERITLKNSRSSEATIRVTRQFSGEDWTILNSTSPYEQEAYNRIRFTFRLPPGERLEITQTYRFKNQTERPWIPRMSR